MYKGFFNFTKTPFAKDMAEKSLFKCRQLDELEGRLAIAAAERQFLVVTGDSGTGKTTAARKFVSMLDPMRYLHFYISDSNLSPRNFYFQILNQLGIKPKFFTGDAKRQMMEELAKIIDARRIPVVTITKRTCAIWKC